MNNSSSNPADHPALSVLRGYWAEMAAWEKEMSTSKTRTDLKTREAWDAWNAVQRSKLRDIYIKYVDAGENAIRLRDQGLSWAEENRVEGDPITKITIKPTRVIVETRNPAFLPMQLRYELIQNNDGWILRDNRKFSMSDSEPPKKSRPL